MEHTETSTIFYLHAVSMFGGRILSGMLNFYNGFFGLSLKDKAKIYKNISNHYMKKGLHQKAVASLKEWAKHDATNPEAQYQLGVALAVTGKTKPAIMVFNRVLKLEPQHVGAMFRKCKLQLKRKEFEEAIEGLCALHELEAHNPEVLYLMAMTYGRLEQVEKAVESMEKAIELVPDEAKYYQHLGFLYESLGKSAEAAKCFTWVMELEGEEEELDF